MEVRPLSKAVLHITLLVAILLFFDLSMSVGSAYANENVHVVEPGETLSEIAVAYGVDVETLRSLNDLNDIDLVWVGLPLTLPMALDSAEGTSTETLRIEDSLLLILGLRPIELNLAIRCHRLLLPMV